MRYVMQHSDHGMPHVTTWYAQERFIVQACDIEEAKRTMSIEFPDSKPDSWHDSGFNPDTYKEHEDVRVF